MNRVKKTARILMLAVLICAMLATAVFAAEEGSLWLNTDETAVLLVTDTTVTDGVVEITYDSAALTYEDVVVDEAYVAMYAVNADEPGVVKISWVAPEAYETDGSGIGLIQVNFSGDAGDTAVTLTGEANDAEGNPVKLGTAPDTTELEKAILEAEGLKEDSYTEESWTALEEALENARAVLDDPTATQEEVDAAEAALREAMDALVLKESQGSDGVDTSELEKAIAKAEGLNQDKYTKESFAAMEKALKEAKAVLADENATQEEVDAAAEALNNAIKALVLVSSNSADTGDNSNLLLPVVTAVVAVIAIAAVAVVMIKSKKERKA